MVFFCHDITEQMENIGTEAEFFSDNIYEEHLIEASFLYQQRLFILSESNCPWPDTEMIENRIRTHIEALEMDDERVIDVCREQIDEGNPGALYSAVRVFCHLLRDDCIKEVIDGLDPSDHNRIKEVVDALNLDLPDEWVPIIRQLIVSGDAMRIRMAADIIGYRRIPMEDELMDVFYACHDLSHDQALPNIIRAIGRLRIKPAYHYLSHIIRVEHANDKAKHEAHMALLRIKEKNLIDILMADQYAGNWRFLIIGLCGNAEDRKYLRKISVSPFVCDECLLALGLIGDISSVDLLIERLNDPPYSEAAALSLHVLTGADLFEDVFIPEPIDEGNLFDDQIEKLKNGEPVYPPGEEPGEIVNRLSQNPEAWKTWWYKHKKNFRDHVFYRYGEPCSPSGILKALESEKSPAFLRQLAYEEFVIRYDKDIYFDIMFPASDQRTAINAYKNWVEAKKP